MNEVMSELQQKLQKCVEGVDAQLGKIRSGRAHPQLLDHIKVEVYGSTMLLPQCAAINVEGPRSLLVAPWDKSQVAACEKALRSSDLGLNPARNGDVLRVPLPALTEERRRDMVKCAKEQAENGKISARNARRQAMTAVKALLKDASITEDDERRLESEINKVTEAAVSKITRLCQEKEEDLLRV